MTAPCDAPAMARSNIHGLGFTLFVCLAAGILCGLLPALRARLRDLYGVLKQGGKGSAAPGSHGVHNTLVVAEIALALVPLIGAGLLLQSFRHLLDVAPGFQTDHILSLQLTQATLPPDQADTPNTPYRGLVTRDGWKYVCFKNQSWLQSNLNEDPYEEGWMIAIEPADAKELDALMDVKAYRAFVEEQE